MSTAASLLQQAREHQRSGEVVRAAELCRQVLVTDPQNADARDLLASATVALDRRSPTAQAKLGDSLKALRRFPEAIAAYCQALALGNDWADSEVDPLRMWSDSDHLSALTSLGECWQTLGNYGEAEDCYQQVLAQRPTDNRALFNYAMVLHLQNRVDEAEAAFEQCVARMPQRADMHFSLAKFLWLQGQDARAIASFENAIALRPEYADAHYHCGLAQLAAGNFAVGWQERDWRLKLLDRKLSLPEWDGGPLHGRRILVHLEQGLGLGDTLQFIRYVPLLQERGGRAIVEVQPALIPLLARSGFEHLLAAGEAIPSDCELQVSLWSLPRYFGDPPGDVVSVAPYIVAEPPRIEVWRQKLQRFAGPRIGIHWRASEISPERSIPLAEFAALASVGACTLVSLQKNTGSEELAMLGNRFPVVDFGDDLDSTGGAFLDTAAIMRNLDLVVTCDTAIAHLAGALGVPVWVALARVADWRWLRDRDASPWYPTMRLFRQSRAGDWSTVFERMAGELRRRTAKSFQL